jgi:hypothetical protein
MTANFRRLGEYRLYVFADKDCIQCNCWTPDLLPPDDSGEPRFGCTKQLVGCPPGWARDPSPKLEAKRVKEEHWVLADDARRRKP